MEVFITNELLTAPHGLCTPLIAGGPLILIAPVDPSHRSLFFGVDSVMTILVVLPMSYVMITVMDLV